MYFGLEVRQLASEADLSTVCSGRLLSRPERAAAEGILCSPRQLSLKLQNSKGTFLEEILVNTSEFKV